MIGAANRSAVSPYNGFAQAQADSCPLVAVSLAVAVYAGTVKKRTNDIRRSARSLVPNGFGPQGRGRFNAAIHRVAA